MLEAFCTYSSNTSGTHLSSVFTQLTLHQFNHSTEIQKQEISCDSSTKKEISWVWHALGAGKATWQT